VQPLTLDGRAMLGTISPDGQFLVYKHASERDIRLRHIPSEKDVRLVEPKHFSRVSSLTVTPDGQSVDVVAVTGTAASTDVWRVPLLGGNPQQLLRNVVSAIGWSPDGRTMAFLRTGPGSDEMTVVLANADGSSPRELTRRRAPKVFYSDLTTRAGRPPSRPAWSPDGELLVLTGYSQGTFHELSELVVLDARTGAERRIVPMTGGWSEVAWLDDTRWLLIGGERPGNVGASGLWASDLSGHQLTPLTREFGFFMNLSVTADRTTAVARRFSVLTGIWISDGSGSHAHNVLTVSPAGATLPSLDSAGGLIYTAFRLDGVVAVYRLAPGASTPVQIVDRTFPPFAGRFFDVSPDGHTIVYTEVERPHGLFRVQPDGSGRVRLENDARLPRLTPDGKTVVFTRSSRPGIYSIPTSGGAVRQLTDRVVRDGEERPLYRGVMSVAPDGRRLLFNTDQPGVVAVCDLPACQNMKELRLPSTFWAPDSVGVAYLQNGTTIMEQPLDGGLPRVLARLEGNEPIVDFRWSPDGSRLVTSRGFHPNDMVIIKRVR
jgi:Tol biopolymer transport system component